MDNGGIAFQCKWNNTAFGEFCDSGKDYKVLFWQQEFFVCVKIRLTLEHDSIKWET